MNPSCLASVVQAAPGVMVLCSWHTLDPFAPVEHHLNTTTNPFNHDHKAEPKGPSQLMGANLYTLGSAACNNNLDAQ